MTRLLRFSGLAALGVGLWGCSVMPSADTTATQASLGGDEANVGGPTTPATNDADGTVSGVVDPNTEGGAGVSPGENPTRVVFLRNRLLATAEVTLVFSLGGEFVHLSYLEILPNTITRVVSPVDFDGIRLKGQDVGGSGIDESSISLADAQQAPLFIEIGVAANSGDADGGVEAPDSGTLLEFLSPTEDVEVVPGDAVQVAWRDESLTTPWLVRLSMTDDFQKPREEWIRLSPDLPGHLDGLYDQYTVYIPLAPKGRYWIVLESLNADNVRTSASSGFQLNVGEEFSRSAPRLEFLLQEGDFQFDAADRLTVRWRDEDPDDDALIAFRLITMPLLPQPFEYVLASGIHEDPDGPDEMDSASFSLADVLPAPYQLVAEMTDGRFFSRAFIDLGVELAGDGARTAAPWIIVMNSRETQTVRRGEMVAVEWADGDEDSNARIALELKGAEGLHDAIVLASSIPEDPDGPAGDQISVAIPRIVAPGFYRIRAAISDGERVAYSLAQGVIEVVADTSPENPLPGWSLTVLTPSVDRFSQAGDVAEVEFHLFRDGVLVLDPLETVTVTLSQPAGYAPSSSLTVSATWDAQRGRHRAAFALPAISSDGPSDRDFQVQVSWISSEGQSVGGAAPAKIWIREEPRIESLSVTGPICPSSCEGDFCASIHAKLRVEWRGGGFFTGPEPVEFWMARVGSWSLGLGDRPEDHFFLQTGDERLGESQFFEVTLKDVNGLTNGSFDIIGVVQDPFVGQVLFKDPRTVEVCGASARGSSHQPG